MRESALASIAALFRGLSGPVGYAPNDDDAAALYADARVVCLRVVVLACAEQRGLLSAHDAGSVTRFRDELVAGAVTHAWRRLLAVCDERSEEGEPQRPGARLFGPESLEFLGHHAGRWRVDDAAVRDVLEPLLDAVRSHSRFGHLAVECIGELSASLLDFMAVAAGSSRDARDRALAREGGLFLLMPRKGRRHGGAHYTPRALADEVVAHALEPLLAAQHGGDAEERVLDLRVCDPAMGAGAFLLAACRTLASTLVGIWNQRTVAGSKNGDDLARARQLVALRCLYGVDIDPLAVGLARASLWLFVCTPDLPLSAFEQSLRAGDSLTGTAEASAAAPRDRIGADTELMTQLARAKCDRPPCDAFAWRSEFSDVFYRARPGFDVIVSNPPFLGGKRISTTLGRRYADWLAALEPGAGRNADLVAHFVRRGYALLREGGTLGLIATNTIAQGDTREAGLAHVIEQGGVIYRATRRRAWPGQAAVVASIVYVRKGAEAGRPHLDGEPVARISSRLSAGSERTPERLAENRGIAFIGCFLRSMGFTFDDAAPGASTLDDMHRILEADARNADVIFPYLGGEELNASPTHAHRRYVIHFGSRTEQEARAYVAPFAIVERLVRPAREGLSDSVADRAHKRAWWRFANSRPELARAIAGLDRVLVVGRVSRAAAFAFVPRGAVFSEQLVVFALDDYASFAVLGSRVHEAWARCYSSTLGDGLRYAPSDCFETFPFPGQYRDDQQLVEAGAAYDEARASWMAGRGLGLTAASRCLDDPTEQSTDTSLLRARGDAVDGAVLRAYGWSDIDPVRAFLPARVGCNGRAVRYRLPDATREEILARLLALNHLRAAARTRGNLSR